METINNIASSASKLVWGEQNTTTTQNETTGTEPISGLQGKGTADEPYDQGNTDPISTTNHPESNTISSKSDSTPDTTDLSASNPTTSKRDSIHDIPSSNKMSSTPNTAGSSNPINPNSAAAGGPPKPHEETDKTGVVSGMGQSTKGSDVIPSEASSNPGAPSTDDGSLKQKQQGADRPHEEPKEEDRDDPDAFLKTKDPNDHSGEPMKLHDGPAEKVASTQAERRESKVGNPGGQEHGKDEPKGTGEEWVKTTGLAADGGDFDATKPGAGREADRLLEEKGIKKSEPGKPAPEPSTGAAEKEKVPLSEKIKAKLHIGHKDK